MKKNIYHPLPGFVVLEQLEETHYGNIEIPENTASKDSAGVVIAVGSSFMYYEGNAGVVVESPVKVGDKVIFKNTAAQRYFPFEGGKQIYMLKFHQNPVYSDLMCVIKD
jgi:co-chaperonin GroES (HSP10)